MYTYVKGWWGAGRGCLDILFSWSVVLPPGSIKTEILSQKGC